MSDAGSSDEGFQDVAALLDECEISGDSVSREKSAVAIGSFLALSCSAHSVCVKLQYHRQNRRMN